MLTTTKTQKEATITSEHTRTSMWMRRSPLSTCRLRPQRQQREVQLVAPNHRSRLDPKSMMRWHANTRVLLLRSLHARPHWLLS